MTALDEMITTLAAPGRLLPPPPVWKVKAWVQGHKEPRVMHRTFTNRQDLDAYMEWRERLGAIGFDVRGPGVDYFSGTDGSWSQYKEK